MSKWYVKSNTVEKIVSIPHSTPLDAAIEVFNDTNDFDINSVLILAISSGFFLPIAFLNMSASDKSKFDIVDEYFYVDERGMRDYTSADSLTQVIKTTKVMTKSAERG